MINYKTPQQIEAMSQGGKIARFVLEELIKATRVGVTLRELDLLAERLILDKGAEPSFKRVDDYKYTTCINLNDGIVHGIPNATKIKHGDVVSLDLGVFYKGLHTDLSHTLEVGTKLHGEFLAIGARALEAGIEACSVGRKIGDISHAIQKTVEQAGFSVSRDLVGHGVGVELHEDPYVPCFGKAGTGPTVEEGMVLAIEVIYQEGHPDIVLEEDGWTLSTKDGTLSGLFEKTIAVSRGETLVLT
jgi:methionyl aminopeptidase